MSSLTKIDVLVPRPKETRTKLDSTRIPVRRWTGGFYSCWLSDSTSLYVFLSLAVFFFFLLYPVDGLTERSDQYGALLGQKEKRVVKTTPLCYGKMAEHVSCFCNLVGVLN